MSAEPNRAELTEAETELAESLLACECGHGLDTHNGLGCYARLSCDPVMTCLCVLTDDRTHAELLALRLPAYIAAREAAAEQRGREDNALHDMCYVSGSKALEAREAAARREALLEAADRWVDERTDLLKSREAWRERAEAAESARTGDGWPEALREQGRVLRALGVAIEWEQIAREQRPHLGCLDMYNHCAGELRAALAEPERDEEGGR